MTIAAAQLLGAWSEVFSSPAITELTPGRVWEVTTERGDRYVLKKVSTFNAADPARRFTDEARIVTYLLQRGVPVAVPVLSNDGKAYTTDDDGAPQAVFPMLPNDGADNDLELDPVLLQNVGAAIARLHAALADCPFGVESWEAGPGLLPALWQTAEDRLPAAALTELSARILPRWDSIVQALSAAPQRVHGDVHGGNLLTNGQEVTGIIDIDHLPMAPRGYDLGYYMAFAVQWRLDDGNQPSQPVDVAAPFITRHLLTGYDAVSRLTRQENDDLPALALAAALGLIDYFVREYDLVEESWLRTAHWIGDNFDALRLPASAFGALSLNSGVESARLPQELRCLLFRGRGRRGGGCWGCAGRRSITSEYRKAGALRAVAGAVAATDPGRAETIANSITDEPSKAAALRAVAGAVAATDPARAETIANSITSEYRKAGRCAPWREQWRPPIPVRTPLVNAPSGQTFIVTLLSDLIVAGVREGAECRWSRGRMTACRR